TGVVPAMVWDDAERLDRCFGPDDVVGVRGRVGSYNEKLQLTVTVIQALEVADDDLSLFLPGSPRDRGVMGKELDALVETVADLPLRTLLVRCVGRKTPLGQSFRLHPAAKKNHHAYLGGLMEHSLSVARACDGLCAHYRAQGAALDRDLLLAGALLHDIGKVRELTARRSFHYTDEGQLLGHILLGLQIVTREAESIPGLGPERLLHLQHLIASHQGRHEWASPKVPHTLEALILHYADDLDAKVNPGMRLLEGVEPGGWTGYDRSLDRALYRPPEFPADGPLQPVEPREVATALIDMFRG
ncbi:MAG TPA: HD domain-containing protein, partial [Longimicrobium sp.]|nr:HD domain-containing protein [Longimicrobium sp.]